MATADTHSTARLEDVAALANVSLATASKALHGKPRVSEDTRERVMEAARQLNYSPNKLAQSLASGRSGTIGLVTSDLQGRFSTPILIGAENELRAQSTSVLLANARGDDALERSHVEKLLSLKVDGLLIVQCETNPRPSLGRNWGVPLVYVYGPSTDTNDSSSGKESFPKVHIFPFSFVVQSGICPYTVRKFCAAVRHVRRLRSVSSFQPCPQTAEKIFQHLAAFFFQHALKQADLMIKCRFLQQVID